MVGDTVTTTLKVALMIRPLQAEDIPMIAGWIPAVPLWARYGTTTTKIETNLRQAFERGDLLLVADIDREGSANALVWCMIGGAFGRSAYLRLLGIQNGYTGRRVGGGLLQEAEHHVRAIQQDMFLLVSDFNADAQRFYQRQGYQQVGAIPGYVLPDVTELIFWKSLSSPGT